LNDLANRIPDLTDDLACVRRLLQVDVPNSLQQIRYVAEKVLRTLCLSREGCAVGVGLTGEQVIDNLVAAGAPA
jgi:hypothetical protein